MKKTKQEIENEFFWNSKSIAVRAHRHFSLLLETNTEKVKWLIKDVAKELKLNCSYIKKVIQQVKNF